ncbi:MAG: putative inorganic carbon (HCO3(-)) transporter [Verrucomicrobiales bacterium]|jgi:putative inorganic carbon (HCO3(-)) transporter
MTTIPTSDTGDRVSIRADDEVSEPVESSTPRPGPGSIFVVLGAIAIGLAAAFAFQSLSPDTPFVILGGTVMSAVVLAIIGLYRYEWFLLITLAVRPALDDLIADELGTFQPSAILGILAILITLLHLISRRLTGSWNRLTPLGLAFIGFFVLFVPSFITSVDRGVSQAAMFGLASVVLLYLAIEQHMLDDGNFLFKLLAASGIGMIIPIITGLVQFFFTGTLDPGGSGLVRIDGSFAHPNTFATYLTFMVLIAISLISVVDVKQKLIVISAASIGGFLLIATFARGAWASFLIGALIMAVRVNRKLVLVIIFGAFAVSAAVPGVGDRISNLTATTGANGGVKTDDSLGWRIGYWEKIWPFMSRSPVTGLGIDATKTQTIEAKDPHNSFLQAFLEGGLLGGTGFIVLLGVATYAGVKTWKKARRNQLERRTRLISVGAIAGLLSVAAQLITENVLLNTIVWWYLNIAFAHLAVLTWGARTNSSTKPDLDQAIPNSDRRQPSRGST